MWCLLHRLPNQGLSFVFIAADANGSNHSGEKANEPRCHKQYRPWHDDCKEEDSSLDAFSVLEHNDDNEQQEYNNSDQFRLFHDEPPFWYLIRYSLLGRRLMVFPERIGLNCNSERIPARLLRGASMIDPDPTYRVPLELLSLCKHLSQRL